MISYLLPRTRGAFSKHRANIALQVLRIVGLFSQPRSSSKPQSKYRHADPLLGTFIKLWLLSRTSRPPSPFSDVVSALRQIKVAAQGYTEPPMPWWVVIHGRPRDHIWACSSLADSHVAIACLALHHHKSNSFNTAVSVALQSLMSSRSRITTAICARFAASATRLKFLT